MNWSKEQKQAIEKEGANILVSASAGSGKTTVLVERIINKVVNKKIDIDKLLVVTFTNAAASEMKQRLLEAIYKKIDLNPEDEFLQRQVLLLNRAHISTIHAFCLDVIRNNFFELGIPANFRVADTAEIEIMKEEIIEDLFEEKYELQDEKFLNLLELYTTYKDDKMLKDIILEIYEFTRCVPYPEKWLEEKIEEFNIENKDFLDTVWGKYLIDDAENLKENVLLNLELARKKVENNVELIDYLALISNDIEEVKNIKLDTWDDFYLGVTEKEFDSWPLKRKMLEESKIAKEEAKISRDEARKIFNDKLKTMAVCNSKEAMEDMREMYVVLKSLQELILEFTKKFEEKKKEKNIIDFSDIEHFALKLLVNEDGQKTEIAKKYEFEEVLIDEYQDSNLVQESILNSVSNGRNIFMVGDVKQSIYRFRQARPDLFLDKYEKYEKVKDEDLKLERNTKIQLYDNYRSRNEVLNITNEIFESIMSKKLGEIDYNKEEFLNFAGTFEEKDIDCRAELNIIEMNEAKDEEQEELSKMKDNLQDESDEEVTSKSILEARLVAKKIKELISKGINYKDIAILLRSTKVEAPIYEKELLEQGIPVFSDTASEFLESIEISTILSLLKIIDNPLQDIPLVTVLRSPIGGFTENELVEIRLMDKDAPFFRALEKTDTDKAKRFLNMVESFRIAEKELPLDELIWKIYSETGYYHYARLMPNGKLRQANLKKLFEKAKDYEKISFKGLFNFINFIEKVSLKQSGIQDAKIIGENDDVVRIMSIHKSKGLEFRIVFLCGVDKKINLQDLKNRIILDQDLGLGVNYIGNGMEYSTLCKEAIKLKLRNEAISEDMRVLYVALTRAKEKLIIIGADKDVRESLENKKQELEKQKAKENKLSPMLIGKYTRFLDWIELVYMYNSKVSLNLNIIDKKEFSKEEKKEKYSNNIDLSNMEFDEEKYNKVDKLLNWEYPYKESIELLSKTSVSKLKEENLDIKKEKEVKNKLSDFNIEEDFKITGAKLGSLIHLAIQKLNDSFFDIDSVIENLKVTDKEKEALRENITVLENYTKSNIYEELKTAKEKHSEAPFYMNIEYGDSKEKVLVQGVIDLYYINDKNELILVDFKTDKNVDKDEIIERYSYQLELYKDAIEKSLKRKVDKVYIYSTYLESAINL